MKTVVLILAVVMLFVLLVWIVLKKECHKMMNGSETDIHDCVVRG